MMIKRTLPKEWRWANVGDICEIRTGKKDVNQGNPNGAYPFFTCAQEHTFSDTYSFDSESLLIAGNGDVGAVKYYKGKFEAYQRTYVLSNFKEVDPKYLYYVLKGSLKETVSAQKLGNTMPYIKLGMLTSFQVPLSPLSEQQRIIAMLDEKFATIEQARLAAEESLSAAWELPSAYLQEVFGSDVSNKWTKTQLGEVLNLRKEVIHPYDNPKGPAVFVGLEHVESNTGIRIGSVEVEMSKLTGRKPKYYKGDIVYGYLRPYLNKVWVAEFDGLCSVDQYVYSVDENKADIDFIAWFMRSPIYLKRAPVNGAPGQLPRIRTEEVASVEINLPPLNEQKKIASQISKKLSTTNELINKLESQLAEIESLPSAVLGQAFGGQL